MIEEFNVLDLKPMKALSPGLVYEQTYVTTHEMRARQLTRDVLSSPAMIGLMERTCVEALAPYLEPTNKPLVFTLTSNISRPPQSAKRFP